ncbi:MAG: class I SAM-dependent methyltransferase [Anaerolineae bacterium]
MTETVGCAFCGSFSFTPLFSAAGFDDPTEPFDLVECSNCHLVRTAPTLTGEQLGKYYRLDYYGSFENKFNPLVEFLLALATRARAELLMWNLPSPQRGTWPVRVLDVGCGRGLMLRMLARRGYACFGVELPGFVFPEPSEGIVWMHGRIEELGLETGYFDAVLIWHVLEHTLDPAVTLREIARVCKPGGLISIAVPNFSSLQRRLFQRHWFHLDLPRHTHHFSRPVLEKMLATNGLALVNVRTDSPVQNLSGFVFSCLNTLFPRSPNEFYMLLKSRSHLGREKRAWVIFLFYALIALFCVPAAFIEVLLTSLFGNGATLVVSARKIDNPQTDRWA